MRKRISKGIFWPFEVFWIRVDEEAKTCGSGLVKGMNQTYFLQIHTADIFVNTLNFKNINVL